MAYSYKFRQTVIDYMKRQSSMSLNQVARHFSISPSTLITWKNKGIASKLFNRKNNLKLNMKRLEEYVLNNPDMYQKEIAIEFKVWPSTICLALKRLGITRKKRLSKYEARSV